MNHLTLFHQADPAQVRVELTLDRGQPQATETAFDFSVTDEERRRIQWYLEEYLQFPWGEFRTRAAEVEAEMDALGARLFEAIFGVGRAPHDPYIATVRNDLANTRIAVHAGGNEGIAIPWELMRDPALGQGGYLAQHAASFVRSQPGLTLHPFEERTDEETFNILLVISRPYRDNDVPFQSVARRLLELFREHRDRIHLDVLRPPTLEQLARVLEEKPGFYHVLHFDGHGAFPEGGAGHGFYSAEDEQGRLLFENDEGEPQRVDGGTLGDMLVTSQVPVVVLNACQSGMTRPQALYPSIGNQLLQAGARGVVAMAYSVYVETAVQFLARFYGALINGREVSRAVSLGRAHLRARPQRRSPIGEVPLRDWIVPIVFEAADTRVVAQPVSEVRLDPDLLSDEQAVAGTEVGCPERPAFGFVGRDAVTQDLERAFRSQTIVLLQGMAGIGKTEMAVGFARWWNETGGLEGPVFFFKFEHYLPLSQVIARIGQVFQPLLKNQLGEEWELLEPEEKRLRAIDILRKIPCLLIWDNFEPVAGFPTGTPSDWTDDEQAELKGFLSALQGGRTKVLITSRRAEPWLEPLYRPVVLGGLERREAQDLAVEVLQRAGLEPHQLRELPDYNGLLAYLGGNPLAIQVVLPLLQDMPPDALLAALQSGEAALPLDDVALGRQRSLAASLTYRLDRLDPTLRQRLGVLALFQGFVETPVLAGMCQRIEGAPELIRGLGVDDWARMLDAAAEIGLLRRHGVGHYTMHPALPWFFHDVLREALAEHVEWLERAFARAVGSLGSLLDDEFHKNPQNAMTGLRLEEGNLLHALRLARRHEEWEAAQTALYGINRLWTTQGRWTEWERLIADLEAEVTDDDGEPLPGREALWRALLGHRSRIASYRRDFDAEESIHVRLKGHYESVGDERNLAVALHQLGRIAQERRHFDAAERRYRQSLEIKERIGNEHGQAISLHQLGMIAEERRRFDDAQRWYRESLEIEERIGDEYGQAGTLHQLGRVAEERRRFADAERWYRKSLEIRERIGDEHGQASTLHQLGIIAQERRRFADAERWYRQSLEIEERIGNEHGQAGSLHQLGMVAEERGDAAGALRLYRQAEAIFVRMDDPHNLGIARESIARVSGVGDA